MIAADQHDATSAAECQLARLALSGASSDRMSGAQLVSRRCLAEHPSRLRASRCEAPWQACWRRAQLAPQYAPGRGGSPVLANSLSQLDQVSLCTGWPNVISHPNGNPSGSTCISSAQRYLNNRGDPSSYEADHELQFEPNPIGLLLSASQMATYLPSQAAA